MILKMLAYGLLLTDNAYLRDAWNVMDAVVVLVGWLAYLPGETMASLPSVSSLRTLRVLRPLRAIKQVPAMRVLVNSLIKAVRRSLATNISEHVDGERRGPAPIGDGERRGPAPIGSYLMVPSRPFRCHPRILRSLWCSPSACSERTIRARAVRALFDVVVLYLFLFLIFGVFSLQLFNGRLHQKCVADFGNGTSTLLIPNLDSLCQVDSSCNVGTYGRRDCEHIGSCGQLFYQKVALELAELDPDSMPAPWRGKIGSVGWRSNDTAVHELFDRLSENILVIISIMTTPPWCNVLRPGSCHPVPQSPAVHTRRRQTRRCWYLIQTQQRSCARWHR